MALVFSTFTIKPRAFSWLMGMAMLLLASGIVMAQKRATENEHIRRVEGGLMTNVVFKREPALLKLADRMAHYDTPGMSVAVINNGKLEWVKGYGVLQAGGTLPR